MSDSADRSRTPRRAGNAEVASEPHRTPRVGVLLLDVAVGKTVAPIGPPGSTDVAATRSERPARETCADASRATSTQLLTGVENGFEAFARGFPDSHRREQRFVRSTAADARGRTHAPRRRPDRLAPGALTRSISTRATPFAPEQSPCVRPATVVPIVHRESSCGSPEWAASCRRARAGWQLEQSGRPEPEKASRAASAGTAVFRSRPEARVCCGNSRTRTAM
jgi:hypothetical protein